MEITGAFLALAIPATVFAGISKAGFGSGAAFASAALLALVIDPALALGVMLPLLMLVDVLTLRPYWGRWSWRDARLLMVGALPGVALGAAVFTIANEDVLRFLIGLVSLVFVAYQLASARGLVPARSEPFSNPVGLVSGGIAGFTSFVSHAGGPPVAIYLLAQGIGKTTYQATTVLVFFAINIMKFFPYLALGAFTAETWRVGIILAPFAAIGAWLGVKAHHLVPENLFFRLVYVLLTLTGSKLIWDALT